MSSSLPNVFVNLKRFPILIVFLFCSLVAFSQSSYTWTGAVDNNWTTPGNWSPARTTPAVSDHLLFNSGGAVEVSGLVNQSIDRLVISGNTSLTLTATAASQVLSVRNGSAALDMQVQSGSSLTVGTNVNLTMQSISQFEVQTGATMTIATGRTFTVTAVAGTGGTFGGTLNLEGAVSMNAPAAVVFSGTWNNLPTSGGITSAVASLQFTSTAKYNHLRAGGVFPTATWHADSEVLVNVPASATGNIAITGGQTFGKFTYDSPDQTSTVSLGLGSPSSFIGNLDVISTGSGAMSLATAATTINIAGHLNIAGTSNVLMNTGAAVVTTLNIAGDFNLAPTASFARGTATSNQIIGFTAGVAPSYFNNDGTYDGTGIGITVNAGAVLHLVNDVPSTGVNTIAGTLYFNTKKFTGTGTFTTTSAATTHLYIDHPEGLPLGTASAGNIQMSGAKTYGTAANYYYVGTALQVTGAGLPGTVTGQITVDNPASLTLTNSLTINSPGAFNFNQGNLILGANTLQVHSNLSFVGANYDSEHMVVADGAGQLKLGITGTATPLFTFPVGDSNGNYTPVDLEIVSGGATRTLGVNLVLGEHPGNMGAANYLNRYWSFTNLTAGNPVVNATFTYVPSDVVGSESAITLQRYNTTPSWTTINSTQSGNTFTITGEAGFVNPAATTPFDITARSGTGVIYRTKGNGNWNDVANWEYGANASGPWYNATVLPTTVNSDKIEVVAGHTVTVTAAATADDVEVNGTLVIASGITFTVANGPAAFDMVVNGTVINGNAATIGVITSTGAVQFAAGSTYQHAKPAGTIPTATWDTNATCLVTGATTAAPAGLGQTFGNFIWNCAGQTGNISFFTAAATMTVTGDFNVLNTGSFYVNLIAGTSPSATLNVGRDFNMSGGTFISKMGTTGTGTISVSGKFRQTNGTMRLYAGTTTGGGVIAVSDSLLLLGGTLDMSSASTVSVSRIDVFGHFYQDGGALTVSGTGNSNNSLNLNGASTTYTHISGTHDNAKINYAVNAVGADVTLISPINPAASRTFTIIAGGTLRMNGHNMVFANAGSMSVSGTLDLGTSIISNTTGATTFTLASGGTLLIGSPEGISTTGATGNIQVTSSRSYNGAGRYIYNGTVAQITGAGLPATISGAGYLEVNNTAGVALTNNTSITATGLGGLNLANGHLLLGTSNLTIAAATPLNGTFSNSSHIVTNGIGQLVKTYTLGMGAFVFPIGDGTVYSPATLGFTLNGAGNVGFNVYNVVHPNMGAATDYVNRYFATTTTVAAPYTYNLTLGYGAGDVVGTESSMALSRWDGSAWTSYASSLNAGEIVSSQSLTNNNAPLNGTSHFTARTSSIFYYRSIDSGDWHDAINWEVDVEPTFSAPMAATEAPTSANSAGIVISTGNVIQCATGVTVNDVKVEGTLVNITTGASNFVVQGMMAVSATGVYDHARDGGQIPFAIWDSLSVLKVTGAISTNIVTAGNQKFGFIEWNSPSQTGTVSFGLNGTNIVSSDFTVITTGTGTMAFANGASTVSLLNDLNIQGTSNVFMISSGSGVLTLNLAGHFNLNSTASFTRGGTGTQALIFNNTATNKNFNNAGNYNGTGIAVTVNSNAIVTLMHDITNQTVPFNMNGTLYMGDKIIAGTGGSFVVWDANTSHLYIGHADGLSSIANTGQIQLTGAKTYNVKANYYFVGTTAQSTGNGFPTGNMTGSVTFDNPAGITLSNNITLTGVGVLNFLQGNITLGNFNLTAASPLQFNGAPYSASHMVVANGTGRLFIGIPTTPIVSALYPVGDSFGNYTPVTLDFNANSAARNLGVRLVLTEHPSNLGSANYISRYWSFSNTGAGTHNVNATFTYLPSDVVGSEATMTLHRYNPAFASWASLPTLQETNAMTLTGEVNFMNSGVAGDFDIVARSGGGVFYRSKGTSTWNDLANWEYAGSPSGPWYNATVLPNVNNSDKIEVVTGHTVTVTAAATADDIEVNGTLVIGSGITFTVANGPAAFDMVVNGTVINGNAATIGTITATGAVQFTAGSTYEHAKPAGTIPTATWELGSTTLVTGATTAVPGGLTQSFGNFTWNCTGQTAALTMGVTAFTTKGNFSILSTNSQVLNMSAAALTVNIGGDMVLSGTSELRFTTQNTTNAVTANVAGDFNLSGNAILNFRGVNNTTGTESLNISGNYIQTGGTITRTATHSAGAQYGAFLNLNGVGKTFSVTGGTHDNTRINYAVNANGADITLLTPINPAASRTFTIATGATLRMNGQNMVFANAGSMSVSGTLDLGTSIISNTTGATTFSLGATGLLRIGSPDGISITGATGNIQTTGSRTYTAGASYEYMGSVPQIAGLGLTQAVAGNVIVNNAAGLTLSNNTTISNVLTLNEGIVYLNNFNLTLNNINNALAIQGNAPGVNNMIVTNGTGQLFKSFANAPVSFDPFVFPVGDTLGVTEYSPVTMTYSAVNTTNTLGVRVVNEVHPNMAPATSYLNRYWAFTTGLTTYTYEASFKYNAADVVGNINDINGGLFNNTQWLGYDATNAANELTITTAPLTQLSAPLQNSVWTGRNTTPTLYYRTVNHGDWEDENVWETSLDNLNNWIPASIAPNADNSAGILIRNSHQITINNNLDIDQLIFDNLENSTLIVASGVTATVKNGLGNDVTLQGNARLWVYGTLINEGQIAASSATTTYFGANALYEHKQDGGLVPVASWDPTATLLLSSFVTTSPTALGTPAATAFYGTTAGYGNITYNSPSQTGDIMLALGTNVKGNFTVQSTGTGRVSFVNGSSTVTIDGDMNIHDGTIAITGFTANTAGTINLKGNYNQTGGSFNALLGTGTTGVQVFNFIAGPARHFNVSGGTFNTQGLMNFTVQTGAELNLNSAIDLGSGTTSAAAGTRSFTNSGTLWMGSNTISGGVFTSFVNTAAVTVTLGVGHEDGITLVADGSVGNIQTAVRTYGATANYVFYGANANTGSGFTAANTAKFDGVTTNLTANATISGGVGAMTLDSSRVVLNTSNLILSSAAHTIDGVFSNNNMIVTNGTGVLNKTIPAIAVPTQVIYPIGTYDVTSGYEYSPTAITFNAAVTGALTARAIKGAHADIQNPSATTDYLNRWWSLSVSSGLATYTIAQDGLQFHYVQGDVVGNESTLNINRWNADWFPFMTTVDAVNNVLSSPTMGTITNGTANFVLNNGQFTGRNTLIPYHFRTVDNGNWNDPATWEVSTDAAFINPAPVSASTIGYGPNATNSLSILVRNNHQVNVTADTDADQLTIDNIANSRLTIDSLVVFTLKDGLGNDLTLNTNSRLDVRGTLINEGQVSGSTAITTSFYANSLYEHSQNGGLVPVSTWDATSTLLFNKLTTTSPTALGAPTGGFGHIVYNNVDQTADLNLGLSTTIIKGNLQVLSTGTGKIALTSQSGTATVTVNGNFDLVDGIVGVLGYSGTGGTTFALVGHYNQTGGEFYSVLGTATATQGFVFAAGPNRNYTVSGGTFNTLGRMNFAVNLGADVTLNTTIDLGAGTSTSNTRTFTNNGTLWMRSNLITGGAFTTFTNTSAITVTLGVGHAEGIAAVADGNVGNIQTATRVYGPLANYVFNGTTPQITGSGLHHATLGTNTANTLMINNSTGVTQQNAAGTSVNIGVSSQLILTSGSYNIGGDTLQLNTLALNGAAISPLASTSLLSGGYSNLMFGGAASNTNTGLYVPSSIANLNALTVNIATGNEVTLNGALNVHAASGALVLTLGKVATTTSNLLTIVNPAIAALNTGGVNAYVNGPLRRNIDVVSAATYRFPIGKSVYNQLELVNLVTSAQGYVTAEAMDADAAGTAGIGMGGALNTNRYWRATPSSNFITSTNIRLTETPAASLGTANRIGRSATLSGTYNSVGGTVSSATILSAPTQTLTEVVDPALGYFVLGNSGMTLTSITTVHSTTAMVEPGDVNAQILRIQIATGAGSPPLNVNAFDLNTIGVSNTSDILSAAIYYTGTSSTFSNSNQFGSLYLSPSGSYTITGNQDLTASATNYFFLVYNVSTSANLGNLLDAECTQVYMNAGAATPTVTAPAGNRIILRDYCFPGSNSFGPCEILISEYYIAQVAVTSSAGTHYHFNGPSNCSQMYNNYANSSTYDGPAGQVLPGTNITFSVTKSGGSSQRVRIWIDWNNNGLLSDSGELILNTTSSSPTVTVTVPAWVPAGWHRFRVSMGSNQNDDPCWGGNNNGQVQYKDFTLKVGEPCSQPSVAASNIDFNSITGSSVNVTFDRGNGTGGVIVVARQGSAVNASPVAGNTYVGNTVFGNGAQIGTGNFVVYNSNTPLSGPVTVPVTGLTNGQTYHFAVYEYNAGEMCYQLSALIGNVYIIESCTGAPGVATASVSVASVCASGSSTVSLSGVPNQSGYSYQWYSSDVSASGPWTVVSGATSATLVTPTLTTTTWYYNEVTCDNSSLSTPSTVAQVTVVQNNLVATINGEEGPVQICSGDEVQLSVSGATTYSWTSTPVGFTSSMAAPTASHTATRTYHVAGTIAGCTFNTSVTANAFGVTLSASPLVVNLGDDVTLTATIQNQTGEVAYLWAPCDDIDDTMAAVVDATPQGSTLYTVTVFDDNGCTSEASVLVNVIDPSVPNVSPTTVSSGYVGSNLSQAYSSIGGGTLIASGNTIDDNNYPDKSFGSFSNGSGFNFMFNGVTYDSFGINSNGFIWFGETGSAPAATTSSPISTPGFPGNINGVVSALGTDLQGKDNASIRVQITGTAPNRVCTIQWDSFGPFGSYQAFTNIFFFSYWTDRIDFQIRLFENGGANGNRIEFAYADMNPHNLTQSFSAQVGIRGASNTDYVNRTASAGGWPSSSAGSSNTSICTVFSGNSWVGPNTAFRFSPACTASRTVITASNTTVLCDDATVDLTASAGDAYQWYLDGTPIAAPEGTAQVLSNVTTAGNYVAATTMSGCAIPSYITTVKTPSSALPTVNLTSDVELCGAEDAVLTAVPSNQGCSVVYQWQINDEVFYSNSPELELSNLSSNDAIQVHMITSLACVDNDVVSSNVLINYDQPQLVITAPTSIGGDCEAWVDLTASSVTASSTGGDTLTYWMDALATIPLVNPDSVIASGTYYIKLSYGEDGCADIASVNISLSNPTATITSSISTLCAGSSTQVNFTGGPSYGEVTYKVNGGANQYIGLDENGEAVLNTGVLYASRTYTLVSVMGEYCEASQMGSVTITVSSEPEASAGADITASCDDTSVTLSGATATGGTILWTTSGNGTFNNATLQNPIYTLGSLDDFSVTLTMTVTGAPGCGNTIDQVVINIAQPIWYVDADGDGYGDASATPNCTGGVGYADNNLDFCDSNAALNPATAWWVDNDGDGYGIYAHTTGDLGAGCATTYNMLGVGTLVILGGDCNDTNADVNPGATEVCHNGIDDNCNGVQNEGGCPALPPPANDNPLNNNPTIGNNTNVYPNCVSVSGTTLGATTNPATGTRDVWYRFVAISNGISVQVSSTVIDPIIYLFDATNLNTPLEVENIITGTGAEILNYSNLIPGNTYRIAIASANDADGVFSICARQLRMPYCQTNGIKSMCELAHSAVTGAPTMTATFTDVVTDVTTSHTFSGYSYALSAPSLDLRYQSSYDVHITATYPLVNGLGEPEVIQVPGNSVCNITIAPHALIEVKANNRCASTTLNRTAVLSGGYLSGANCNFSSFRFEFTPVDNCAGANPRYDETFTKVIIAAGPNISLNYAFNQLAASSHPSTGYWLVRIRPRFAGYEGEYGPAHVIAVRNTKTNAGMAVEPNFEPVKGVNTLGGNIDANIYPNPNNGELVNLNITGITSNEVYVRVMDSMGREVYTNRYSVDGTLNTMVSFTRPLAQGVYMVEMRAGEEVKTQRMMVTK